MLEFDNIGRLLVIVGVVIVVMGGLFMLIGRVPGLGNLPGDIRIEGERFSCFVPIATSIILSIALTVVLNVVIRLLNQQ